MGLHQKPAGDQRQRIGRTAVMAMLLSATVALSGCGLFAGGEANSYTSSQALGENTVRFGTVVSVRAVTIKNKQSGLGMLGGGVAGGVGGSLLGSGKGSTGAALGGAVLGSVLGSAIEHGMGKGKGVEVTVKLDNGDLTSVTQNTKGDVFSPGQRVRLLTRQGVTRVTPDVG